MKIIAKQFHTEYIGISMPWFLASFALGYTEVSSYGT